MTVLETERLILRNWREDDLDVFHRLNHDEQVMQFFPFRSSREEARKLMENWTARYLENGFEFAAVEMKETGSVVGMCGLSLLKEGDPPAEMFQTEIGWRVIPEFQRDAIATESAMRWLEHAFETLGKTNVCALAVHNNHASTGVMKRLGMREVPEAAFDHPRVPDTHPHLKRCVVYNITAEEWHRLNAA